MKIEKLVQHFA